jgi:hypothetical protein
VEAYQWIDGFDLRPVDGAWINNGVAPATSLIELDGLDVDVGRHERDANTANVASSNPKAIEQCAANGPTRDEIIVSPHD